MRRVSFEQKLAELNVELPALETFWRIGDLTALRQRPDGAYYRSNYMRGPLLYALVAHHRPEVVLEFGTGRGYGALCMARAMADHDVPGTIYTIDLQGYGDKQTWWIDYGEGPQTLELSWADVWPNNFEPDWLKHIACEQGYSHQVLKRWPRSMDRPVEFAFIDGGHRYEVVRHDFYSLLDVAADTFRAVLDDYNSTPSFGVRNLVDEEIAGVFDAELLPLVGDDLNGEPAGPGSDGMVFIDSERSFHAWKQAFPARKVRAELGRCRRHAARAAIVSRLKGIARPLVNTVRQRIT